MNPAADIRLDFADATRAARTLMALLVVLVHVNMLLRPAIVNWWPAGSFTAPFFSVLVPAFFIVSGYFAGSTEAGRAGDRKSFLLKRARRLLMPFFIWNILLYAVESRFSIPLTGQTVFELATGYWQLYFIFVLFQLLVLNSLLFGPRASERRLKSVLLAAGGLSFLYYFTADLALWTKGAAAVIFETHLIKLFIPWCLFFMLGVWLRRRPREIDRLDRRAAWLAAAGAVSYGTYVLELKLSSDRLGFEPLGQFLLSGFPFQVSLALLALVLLTRWRRSAGERFRRHLLFRWSRDTYGIFLSHGAVVTLLLSLFNGLGLLLPFPLEVPLFWAAGWFISRSLVQLIRASAPPPLKGLLLGEFAAPAAARIPGDAVLLLGAFFLLLTTACLGPQAEWPRPAAVEDHSQALARWVEKNIRDATLIHVDAHDDLAPIPAEKVEKLMWLAAQRDFPGLRGARSLTESGLFDDGNFNTAAIALGVANRVIWVTPWDLAGERAFPAERAGASVRACPLGSMAEETGPVILSVDLDFLPAYAFEQEIDEAAAAAELAETLRRKLERPLDVVMSYSVNDGYTPVFLRWLGDYLLGNLGSAGQAESPEGLSLRQELQALEKLRKSGDTAAVLSSADRLAERCPASPYPLLYLADALYLAGNIEGAFKRSRQAAALDKRAAAIFFWIAKGLAIEDRADDAAKFIAAGRAANPDSRDWESSALLAFSFMRVRRLDDALSELERLSSVYASYSAEFLAGEIMMEKGDEASTETRWALGLARLGKAVRPEPRFPEVASAMDAAASFLEKRGKPERAALIRSRRAGF